MQRVSDSQRLVELKISKMVKGGLQGLRQGWPQGVNICGFCGGHDHDHSTIIHGFGCGVFVNILSYGSALLEDSLAFMGSIAKQGDMAPNNVLVRHSKDPLPPWRNSANLFRRCEDIVLSLMPRTPIIPDTPSALAHSILWRPPEAGIMLVELFGSITTGLVAVLEAGLTVRRYIYVNISQVSTRVARHHLQQLMVLYLQQLPLTAIHGCFSRPPCHVTFINEADLRHLGPVDMIITGWSL